MKGVEPVDYSQVWDFNPVWTLEEAQAATEKVCATGAPPHHPHLPIFRWFAHHRVEEQRKAFEAGDKFALMHALRICANHALPMPDWAARAYIRAYDTIVNARAKSWDQVLGAPYSKGTHLAAVRKRRKLQVAVRNRIRALRQSDPDLPIDAALFERVGMELGLGKTLAAEYYYTAKKRMGF